MTPHGPSLHNPFCRHSFPPAATNRAAPVALLNRTILPETCAVQTRRKRQPGKNWSELILAALAEADQIDPPHSAPIFVLEMVIRLRIPPLLVR